MATLATLAGKNVIVTGTYPSVTPVLPQCYPKVPPYQYASNNFEQVEHQASDLRLFNPLLAMAAMSPFSTLPPNQQQMCNPFSPLSKNNTLR